MQENYSSFKQGDIVIMKMQFSTFEEAKIRPALVISSNTYNQHGEDIILLKITSHGKDRPYSVPIAQNDLVSGTLNLDSFVKADFPITVKKDKLFKTIGKVSPKIVQQTKEKLKQILEL
ncbi:MAG: type II toxin-antitoxin system PemK/MazF family toxin [Candidatus Micrarchaeota archaeon]